MEDVAPFLILLAVVGAIAAFVINRKESEGELSTKDLPPVLQRAFATFSEDDKLTYWSQFKKKRRSTVAMVLLAIFFPIQLFFVNKTGLGVAFLLTAGGCGVWWLVEIFLAPKRVRDYNEEIGLQLARDLKFFAPEQGRE